MHAEPDEFAHAAAMSPHRKIHSDHQIPVLTRFHDEQPRNRIHRTGACGIGSHGVETRVFAETQSGIPLAPLGFTGVGVDAVDDEGFLLPALPVASNRQRNGPSKVATAAVTTIALRT